MGLMDEYRERAEREGFDRKPNIVPEVLPTAVERQAIEAKEARTEEEITVLVRSNAEKAATKLSTALDSMDVEAMNREERLAAVRAIADAQNKSIDALMKMTGRDREAPRDNMVDVLAGMAARGFLKVNVDMQVGAPDRPSIPGTTSG